MKKIYCRLIAALCLLATASAATATGWPAGYEGVMLQAFYWDSYSDTQWSKLKAESDELSESFDLLWIPNSARCGGSRNMGYMPIYWFTNHNSSFGSEAQLKSMIETFREKGTGVIGDLVLNHRCGVSNWTDFPSEAWNGRSWKLGPEHICSNDEVAQASGQARPTGAPDTGDNFDGARDLDHTNATVQEHIKNYMVCLMQDYGYTGFRLDMVKGYAGRFTKIYNQYAKPKFCVGEYWDGNYDAVASWIESTGRESAAFDFPCKYAMNEAFSSGDYTKLVWKANGTTDQPAGMIHFGYPQLSVTFIDNHDTYRDGSKFNGNVLAANAFILASPGTPCVFLPHWQAHKEAIKKMIAARKAAGVSNTSKVTVLRSASNCYMAEIQGSKGTLAVRIGNTSDVPSGYSNADLRASGTGYAMWVHDGGQGGGLVDPDPTGEMTVYYDNAPTAWASVLVHYWGAQESTWPGVAMTEAGNNIWKATLPAGTTGVVFNNGNGSQTADVTGLTDGHLYRPGSGSKPPCTDEGVYNGGSGDDPTPGTAPSSLYVLGNLAGSQWDTAAGVAMTRSGNTFTAAGVEFVPAEGQTVCYFNLTTALAADWDELNATADRYGASVEGSPLTGAAPVTMVLYSKGVNASGCLSWSIAPGKYNLQADFDNMTVSAMTSSGIDGISVSEAPAEYYNLQGVRVDNPVHGLYIVRRGSTVTKEYVR